jgi:hypothetical protein
MKNVITTDHSAVDYGAHRNDVVINSKFMAPLQVKNILISLDLANLNAIFKSFERVLLKK